MKKIILYFLLSIQVIAFAQNETHRQENKKMFPDKIIKLEERKEIISSRIWTLMKVSRKDQEGNFMPRKLYGMVFVFKNDGTILMYNCEQKAAAEAKTDNNKYVISEEEITVDTNPKKVYVYTLKPAGNDYELTMTDNTSGVSYHLSAERYTP